MTTDPPPSVDPRLSRAVAATPRRAKASAALALLMAASGILGIPLLLIGLVAGVDWLTTLGAVLLLATVITMLTLGRRMRTHRDRALPVLAREYGWRYSESDPFGLARAGLPFDRFRQRGVQTRNVVWGALDGVDVRGFDLRYQLYDSEGGWQYQGWAFCALAEIPASCPPLWVVRGHDLAADEGRPRVKLESGRFNDEVVLLCPDSYFANAMMDERMMGWLLDSAPPGVHFEAGGSHVLAWKADADEQVGSVLQVVSGLAAFVNHVPRVVFDLYPTPSGGQRPEE